MLCNAAKSLSWAARLCALSLPLLTALPLSAQAIDPPESRGSCHSSINAAVDSLAKAAAVETSIPGMTIAITKDGQLVCNKAFGYANWAEKTPMQPESRSQIGSNTKVLNAIAMMKLIQDRSNVSLTTPVYGSNGILNDADYQNAIVQGTRRHYPMVGLAIGNNNRVNAWYSDGQYTIGSASDLDEHREAQAFSLPSGKSMADVVAIARGGPQNHVYSWYMDGSYSIGTASDLDAHGNFLRRDGSFKIASGRRKSTIAGIAVNTTGDTFYAYYHDGTVSAGDSPENLTNRWDSPREYSVPGQQQRRYNIVDIAHSANGNTLAWYSGGKASRGTATNLSAHTEPFDYTRRPVTGSRANQIAEYESIEVRHLLSHTSGISGSGDSPQAAIKYGVDDYDKQTNPLPYKLSNLYVLSTRALLANVGTQYSYSNHGMGLVGHLVEELTGQDWYEYLRANILLPAGADNIVPRGLYQDVALDANPHNLRKDGTIRTQGLETHNHSGSAAGSLKASAADLARVMVATDGLNNHPDVLSAQTVATMESRPFPSVTSRQAHGWGVKCDDSSCNNRRLSHNGRTGGGTSYIAKYQGSEIDNVTVDGINVAVVSNSGDAKTSNLRRLAHDLAVQAAGSSVPISYDLFVPGSGTLGIEAQ
ncbi:MAG: serine hydrolase domain-containing protein [Cyanobacteria bacterium P01_F01_bin.53]